MPYPISKENMSVIKYYHLDINLIGSIECEGNMNQHLLSIAKAFDEIRGGILERIDLDVIKKAYRDRLHEFGFMSINGSVKYEKFVPDMIEHYGQELLVSLESEIEIETEHNWIKNIHRKKNRKVHPLRHILYILYFFGSLEALKGFINRIPESNHYPCMNYVGGHYRELVLTDADVLITADYKTREPVITLKCPLCGYTYSRKVSDDIYKVGRVKSFGDVWFKELQKIINDDAMGLRSKARHMGCDAGTIKRF